MRGEHDDESGDAGHDGAGQRNRRSGNAGRIGSARLLSGSSPDRSACRSLRWGGFLDATDIMRGRSVVRGSPE
jgi:hypothetical protein